jgi:hypothetical protein
MALSQNERREIITRFGSIHEMRRTCQSCLTHNIPCKHPKRLLPAHELCDKFWQTLALLATLAFALV